MKKFLFIVFLTLTGTFTHAAMQQDTLQQAIIDNVALVDTTKTAVAIDEIVRTKKIPAKEKVEYINQLTKYGFKNLFSKYAYNPSQPYSSQVNPYAENFMQDYLRTHSNSLVKMKTWGMPYFNLIDHIFSQYGLPRELKYLAVIESNLSTGATSWVGAGGPWQFMPYTARDYGLVVNSTHDERRDYTKSTHAAARYLLTLYHQMHDWLLVIAAYNGGPGRVYEAMRKSGSRDFWTLQYYLPQESRNHVKKFIATHYVMETNNGNVYTGNSNNFFSAGGVGNPYDNNLKLSPDEMERSEVQTISGKYIGSIIAKNLSMESAAFSKYNPDFDSKLSANGQYELRLPAEKMQVFIATKYQILNECVQFLLSDANIPNNKTVYPSRKTKNKRN